jgi:ribosome-binding protein aMBF1 (putative translation factor)
LGIAGRTSHVKFAIKPHKSNQPKALPANIQTIGNLIKTKRQAKNLTSGHVALKMGIAASVVCSWEDGSTLPTDWQVERLASILGFYPKEFKATTPKR